MITINTQGGYDMNDAKKGLQKADKLVNKGIMGWITRLFMGKKFTTSINQTLDMGKSTIGMVDRRNELMTTGMNAKADVMSISDTGKMVNYDPVVKIKLNVITDTGDRYETETEQIVSKIAVPRVGDQVNIKYNPNNDREFVII
jgi:hypothetical protein